MVALLLASDAVFQLKCARVEQGSWEWWMLGCWMFPTAAEAIGALTIGGIVGVAAWALRQRGQR